METTPGSKVTVMREPVEKYCAVPMHPFVHSTMEVNYSVRTDGIVSNYPQL